MTGPYHFIEYTKCNYLFPCGKNIILVFLDHGALRSGKKKYEVIHENLSTWRFTFTLL